MPAINHADATDPRSMSYSTYMIRRKRNAIRRFLATYEPYWVEAIEKRGKLVTGDELPRGMSARTFCNNLYRARRIMVADPTLRSTIPQSYDLADTFLSTVQEGVFIAPKDEKRRVITASKLAAPSIVPPPSNVVLYDDRTTYLAMLERAALDPQYLPEANLVVQCTRLMDCGQVMKDLAKVHASGSVVDDERMIVIVISEGPPAPAP